MEGRREKKEEREREKDRGRGGGEESGEEGGGGGEKREEKEEKFSCFSQFLGCRVLLLFPQMGSMPPCTQGGHLRVKFMFKKTS